MAPYKLLIAAAGVGSRLDAMTRYLNKSLVRIGKQPSLGYILDWAPADVPVVVAIGYRGNLVRDYLELAFPERTFEFVTVDPYEGPDSSMGYSLLATRAHLDCPFILSSCDTLVFSNFQPPDRNWIGVSLSDDSAQYSTVLCANNRVMRINEKGAADFDFAYIGLIGVKDHAAFWENLAAAHAAAPLDSALNDCVAVERMLESGHDFEVVQFSDWLDIGNSRALGHARRAIKDSFDNLEKTDEAIYIREPDHVIKFFHDPKTVAQRVRRAAILGDSVPKVGPVRRNFYRYEYSQGALLAPNVNERSVQELFEWCRGNLWRPVELDASEREAFVSVCSNFYKDKTLGRVQKFVEPFSISDEAIVVNGIPVPQLVQLLEAIDWAWLCDGTPTGFHGDLHFENIIINRDENGVAAFKLLDWRQDFGGVEEYGDVYYDLAKLNHGMLVSHDVVRRDLFNVKISGNNVTCDILRPDRLVRCQERFLMLLRHYGYDVHKVEVLTALIFLNIAVLHHYPYSTFLYYYGRDRLAHALAGATLVSRAA